jgi:hypothetical protein
MGQGTSGAMALDASPVALGRVTAGSPTSSTSMPAGALSVFERLAGALVDPARRDRAMATAF